MKRKLFSAYTDSIERALSNPGILNELHLKANNRQFNKATENTISHYSGNKNINLSEDLTGLESVEIGISPLKKLLGLTNTIEIRHGDHKDYAHLRVNGGKDKGYIVSCFIDVRRSTSLFANKKGYNHDQIATIIQTIQAAAIHTCSLFNGHIQRLQYDGVFVYFGGKNYSKEQAIKDSLNATSFFTYFIKYELPEIFERFGIDQIHTKTGIDFGDDDQVSWYLFGVGNCSELTTVSLHTSLAPKMQANASANGIVIGDNLINRISILEEFSELISKDNGEINRYIYRDPLYTQWKFDWENYLVKMFSFVKQEENTIYIDYEESSEKLTTPKFAVPDEDLFNIARKSKPHYGG